MRVLITGGGGFLAGHLSAYLQSINSTEVRSLSRRDCDLAKNTRQLIDLLCDFKPAVIFHLAGRIGGSAAELDRDNRLATENLLEAARQAGAPAKIVLGSTVAVYGRGGSAAAPLLESDAANPRGLYAASKYACEQAARSYAENGSWIAIARISNPVGSAMDAALLCGSLAKQIVEIERGEASIVTLRDLTPKRDFVSARDCAAALWRVAEFGKCGETYNVACGASISVAEIVEIYKRLARVRPIQVRVLPGEALRSSIQEQWVSNAKLLELGWQLRQGLEDAIADQLETERARL